VKDDLVERLRDPRYDGQLMMRRAAADRIEELKEALRLADAALSGANMNMGVVEKKVRAALKETGP
jgi:hypothetical protein